MILNRKFFILQAFILIILFNCKIGKIFEKKEKKESNQCLITYIKGKTYLVDQQYKNISELKVGLNINEEDIIKTEEDSAVELQIGESSIVRVKEKSILKIVKLFKDQDIEKTTINLDIGKILAKPKNLTEGSSFEVDTKSVTAGVRGTEFTVVRTKEGVAKIAVNEGEVNVRKNINSKELKKIEKIDAELAKKIESTLQEEVVLKKDEKVEVNDKEYNIFKEETLNEIKKISEDLEAKKNSKDDLEALLKNAEEITIKNIQDRSNEVIKKENVSKDEWKNDFNRDEFKEIGVTVASLKTGIKEKEIEKKEEKEEKEKLEKKHEVQKEKIIVIEKLPYNFGLKLSEKNTAITVGDKNILLSNDLDKTIYCINPDKGEVVWKFKHPKLNKIQSPATFFQKKIILATYSNIFVLDNNGKVLLNKEISNGPLYWASPITYQKKVFIPTARFLYYYDGAAIKQVNEDEFPAALSQLYISSDSRFIFTADSLNCTAKIYDFVNKKVEWTSDKLPNNIFTAPVKSVKYLIAADIKQNLYKFDYQSKNTKPDILKINNGVLSNIISYGENIYFIAKDGVFYVVNVNTFNKARMIMRVDKNPVQDKYLTKKLYRDKNIIYFASDTGKVFIYDLLTGNTDLLEIEDNKNNNPLIGTPVKIKDAIYFVDVKSNIYKMHEKKM